MGVFMLSFYRRALAITLLLGLSACGDPTVADIVKKTEKVGTRADLERALGKPTQLTKLGPVETWTYKAKDGEISFLVTGDTVQASAGGGGRR
jgi:hypothetical protein